MYLILCMLAAQSSLPDQGVVYIHTQMIKPNDLFLCPLAHGYALMHYGMSSLYKVYFGYYIRFILRHKNHCEVTIG
jgi:hypothetical protein